MSARLSNWFSPASVCFLVLWIGLLALAPGHMLGDPGTLWHTIAGERMLHAGQIIRTDPFSFTHQDQPWVAQQWLGEIIMALLHRLAGLDAVVLAAVTLLAATYAWLFGRLLRSGLPWLRGVVLLGLVLAASSYHFLPRPHLATIALMAWMFALLMAVEAGRRSPRWLLALPPAFVLWTNVHGGALGGIATSTFVLLGWLVWGRPPHKTASENVECRIDNVKTRATAAPPSSDDPLRAGISTFYILHSTLFPLLIAVVAGLSFVAVLVNPYGPALPRVWIGLLRSEVLPRLIVEHAPLRIGSVEGVMVMALAGIYLALLVRTWRLQPRLTWLVPLLWFVLALTRVRHGPLFAVTAGLTIADMLTALRADRSVDSAAERASETCWGLVPMHSFAPSGLLTFFNPATHGSRHGLDSLAPSELGSVGLRSVLAPAVVVMLAFALQTAAVPCPVIGAGWSRVSPDRWPVEAVAALRADMAAQNRDYASRADEGRGHATLPPGAQSNMAPQGRGHATESEGVKVFNDLGFGGYLIYAAPQTHVYIDDRCELYGDYGLLEYERFTKDPALIDAVALYADIPYALTRSQSLFDRHLAASPFWKLLHRDRTASLYARSPNSTSCMSYDPGGRPTSHFAAQRAPAANVSRE